MCGAVAAGQTDSDKQPNILLFLVDDMGWQDTSVPFWDKPTDYNRMYHTPNMERLAREGRLFTQAYATPISSPSRCSLMTGASNARHRVTNWTLHRDRTTDLTNDTVSLPDWNYNGISPIPGTNNTYVAPSFVQKLHDGGYHTIHVGKAHFGAKDTPGEYPQAWGFDVNIAGHAAGGLATYLSEHNYGHDANGRPISPMSTPGLEKYWGTGTFITDALTTEAIAALDSARTTGKPWYLYMSHYAVHIPIDRDPRYYDKYIAEGLAPKDAAYASLVEGMDASLGRLLEYVDSTGQADNTIVIFMSDNGGFATDSGWREGELYTQNAPLSSGKGSMHEGGIREPLIVRWPGVAQPGSRTDDMVIIEDFYPTILEMAGMKDSIPDDIDGRSFVKVIEGKGHSDKNREYIWNFPNIWGNNGPGINLNCAIRRGDWKLVYYYTTGKRELFNIKDDIGETTNLAAKKPKITADLSRRLGKALREMDAQRPTFKATGQPCPWPDENI
ncbi:MAG: sulfatase [Muribaculaceae bacterium]|nr:sulfatase [Muribaculaceae bacterium]